MSKRLTSRRAYKMLGYTEQDVESMLDSLNVVLKSLDPKEPLRFDRDKLAEAQESARKGLASTIDLLEGLLAEGRV